MMQFGWIYTVVGELGVFEADEVHWICPVSRNACVCVCVCVCDFCCYPYVSHQVTLSVPGTYDANNVRVSDD